MRFQNHIKHQFVIHKRSIKLAKLKKYKNALGTGQTVRKFTLPKEMEKNFFVKQKERLEKKQK